MLFALPRSALNPLLLTSAPHPGVVPLPSFYTGLKGSTFNELLRGRAQLEGGRTSDRKEEGVLQEGATDTHSNFLALRLYPLSITFLQSSINPPHLLFIYPRSSKRPKQFLPSAPPPGVVPLPARGYATPLSSKYRSIADIGVNGSTLIVP